VFEFQTRVGGLAQQMRDLPQEDLVTTGDVVYTIPIEFPPMVSVGWSTVTRQYGDDVATTWLLETALGSAGLAALTQADVPRDAFVQVLAVIIARTRGLVMEVPSAAPKALRKSAPKRAGSASSPR
jgi:hypothetical protein